MLFLIGEFPRDMAVVTFGGLIAQITHSRVTLFHASEQEDTTLGESILAQASKMLPHLQVESRLFRGDLVTGFVSETRERNYDLVVMGKPRGVRFAWSPLRRTPWSVIRRSVVSILVVGQMRQSLKSVLICTGGSKVAEPVIESGARLAYAAKARVTLLHVATTVPSMYTGLEEIEETLPELLQTDTPIARHLREGAEILARHHPEGNLELRHGIVSDEILRNAQRNDCDLVVVGWPGRSSRIKSLFLGDVIWGVIEHLSCPILLVKRMLPVISGVR